MSSQVGGDLSRIESGPSKVTYKGVACGHTMGGVHFTIKPQLRERKVDEYGDHIVDLIHTGDDVQAKTTFAEKTLAVIQTVYQMSYGMVSTNVVGIGKLPGGKSSSKAGLLLLHPLDGNSTNDDVQFYKAAVADTSEVNFGQVTQDRVFECVWKMLIDESKDDGNLIGQIGVAAV